MEEDELTDSEDIADILEVADLIFGFAWHEEGGHWHVAGYSFPETYTDEQIEQIELLAGEMTERLSQGNFRPPPVPEEE